MTLQIKIPINKTTNIKSCFDYAAAIIRDDIDKQPIMVFINTEIPITFTSTENNEN